MSTFAFPAELTSTPLTPEQLNYLATVPQIIGPDYFDKALAWHMATLDDTAASRAGRHDTCAACGKALAHGEHYWRQIFRCNLRFCEDCAPRIADRMTERYQDLINHLMTAAPPGARFTYIEAAAPVPLDLTTKDTINLSRGIMAEAMSDLRAQLYRVVGDSPTWIYIVGFWDSLLHFRVITLANVTTSPWPSRVAGTIQHFPMYRLLRFFREKLLTVWLPEDPEVAAQHELLFTRVRRLVAKNVKDLHTVEDEGWDEPELLVEGAESSTNNSDSDHHHGGPKCPFCGDRATHETGWMPLHSMPTTEEGYRALPWREIKPTKTE